MPCDDCGSCPECGDELQETDYGYCCADRHGCGLQMHMSARDLARFEEDPDRRPYVWDLEED